MPLKIRNRCLYTDDGTFLKEIMCPKKISENQLSGSYDEHFYCAACNETVLNTDTLSESEIVHALKNSPSLCLYINLFNPTFQVDDDEEV